MYYPYFRGKQFELVTIRESATLFAHKNFIPIIEPVKESLGGLERTLTTIRDAGAKAIVIVNPYHGEHSESGIDPSALLSKGFFGTEAISAGVLLYSDMTPHQATACYDTHRDYNPTIVHAGFTAPKALAEYLGADLAGTRQVFVEVNENALYRRHFEGSTRILVRDGFKRRTRNADYPPVERFSELHVTYRDMSMNGFGDFLIVGDTYSETGGPAYAVAIHLTFIDPDKDDVMFIYHFVSDTQDTPTDPAGKFGQALKKLIDTLNTGESKLIESSAIKEFRALHAKGHFPGLGYVKKLSMKHHIETLAGYIG